MKRVLVVDDNEENRYYLTTLLSARGCQVECARDGVEALEKAQQAPPSVIISDLLMPVMDGFTLLRHWKAEDPLKHIPFVVYTATYTDPEDEELARRLGADAFILKPVEPDVFIEQLERVQTCHASEPAETEAAPNQPGLLREYSERLIHKLESKTLELEASNRQLLQDVEARRRAEQALRESEERFRQLAENLDDIFWLRDLDQTVLYVSPAYDRVWGRSREALYHDPQSWLDLVHPDDRERVAESVAREAVAEKDDEYRIVLPDGTTRCLRARSFPIRDAEGTIYRVAGVWRDVTDYRRLEEQLRHAQKMEAIGRLAGGIAHDFNNLLSVILSYTTLVLADLPEDSAVRHDVEEVLSAGQRGADLTRQLLAFSRQQILQPRVLNLGTVVANMQRLLRPLLNEDIELSLLLSTAGNVYSDPSQIEQVVANLVVNSRDALPHGGKVSIEVADVELDATSHPGVEAGSYVMLAVSDTGSGMDAATREHIFEPFFTTKEQGKGTGLGLSTVFGIVEQSQGHILVESEPGSGTTFRIFFPRTERVAYTPPPSPAIADTMRGNETILLVEDDPQLRSVTSAILQRNGYTVVEAANGEEALEAAAAHSSEIHLVLTDVVMPKMGGRELVQRIRNVRPELRVLYATGYTRDAALKQSSIDVGLVLLQKPVLPKLLLRKVRDVLDEGA